MLAFRGVHSLHRWLAIALVLVSTSGALAAGNKVRLRLQPERPEAVRGGQTALHLEVVIEPGWHINAHEPGESFLIATEVQVTLPPGVSTGTVTYPPPQRKTFAFAPGKELLVYSGTVVIATALDVPGDFIGTRVRAAATLRYQACNDTTCLPPTSATTELLMPISTRAAAPAVPAPAARSGSKLDVGTWIAERGLLVTLLLVGLLGLGLNLTPCVYPLISVTVAYFGAYGHKRLVRMVALAVTYVFGITVSFSIVGVAAALSGGVFGAALQRPPVLIFIAAVLVALALSSFGLYQMQAPRWLLQPASATARGPFGAFFMGLTMGIVAAPCVGPVVLGLLLFVGSQQDVRLGFELFFALGLGMGLPYVALAVVAGSIKALPRSGDWLVWIDRLFGFMLLGLAGYFITPLVPPEIGRLLLPALIAAAGVYLGFIDRSGRRLPYFRSVQRVAGIAAVVVALWTAAPQSAESTIRWQPLNPAGIAAAHTAGQPAVIDFVADWCIPCHEMDASTFVDPDVQAEAARFAMFRADITQESAETAALVDQYEVHGVPTVIFLGSDGRELDRLVGYVGPDEMFDAMRRTR